MIGTWTRVPNSAGIALDATAPERIARGLTGELRALALARAYVPVLAFHGEQRWTPIGVESFLRHRDPQIADAVLTGPAATRGPARAPGAPARVCDPGALVTPCEPRTLENLPTTCPGLAPASRATD